MSIVYEYWVLFTNIEYLRILSIVYEYWVLFTNIEYCLRILSMFKNIEYCLRIFGIVYEYWALFIYETFLIHDGMKTRQCPMILITLFTADLKLWQYTILFPIAN